MGTVPPQQRLFLTCVHIPVVQADRASGWHHHTPRLYFQVKSELGGRAQCFLPTSAFPPQGTQVSQPAAEQGATPVKSCTTHAFSLPWQHCPGRAFRAQDTCRHRDSHRPADSPAKPFLLCPLLPSSTPLFSIEPYTEHASTLNRYSTNTLHVLVNIKVYLKYI